MSSSASASRSGSQKQRVPVEPVPTQVFRDQLDNEVQQLRNNIQLAVSLGKHGDSADVNRKHLSFLVTQQTRRLRSLVNQFKRSVGARRERKNIAEWSKNHPVEAKNLTPPTSEQPHLFDRRLLDLISSQRYTIKVPREGEGKTGRTVITGVDDSKVKLDEYAREFKGSVLSTKSNMRALLGLYISAVGKSTRSGKGGSPVVNLADAREFISLYNNVAEKKITDWRAIPYATAMSLVSMLDSPHEEYLKNGGKAMDLPRVENLSERIKAHKRAVNYETKVRSGAPARPASPRRASPRTTRGGR